MQLQYFSASLLCKIDLSKSECANGNFLTKDRLYAIAWFRPESDFTDGGKKSNNSEVKSEVISAVENILYELQATAAS